MKKLIPIAILTILISCKNSNKPNPQSFEQLTVKGQEYLKNNQIDSAIIVYQKVIKLNPTKPDGHYGLGVAKAILCYQGRSGCHEAIKYLKAADKIEPGFRKTYFNIGTSYIILEDYPKALKFLDKAVKNDSTNGDNYMNRGIVKVRLQRVLDGCEDFKIALKYGHKNAEEVISLNCK